MRKKLNSIISENILCIRLSRKFTQIEIANVLGIRLSPYNKIESGKTQVSVFHLHQLAKHYGVSVNDFCDQSSKFDQADSLQRAEDEVSVLEERKE